MNEIVLNAFTDEVQKIAGELQGATRLGRKPIGVERMLERESEQTGLPEEFHAAVPSAEKTAARISTKSALLLAGGGAAALTARQANEDRKLGRMVRKQQGQ